MKKLTVLLRVNNIFLTARIPEIKMQVGRGVEYLPLGDYVELSSSAYGLYGIDDFNRLGDKIGRSYLLSKSGYDYYDVDFSDGIVRLTRQQKNAFVSGIEASIQKQIQQ